MNATKLLLLGQLFIASYATATTWGPPKSVDDPIKPGATCKGAEPMSSGSYIYQWPSKYDQVFWPLTDENSLWVCPQSGYVAFLGDFELTPEEVAAVKLRLGQSYKPIRGKWTLSEKLKWLKESYDSRSKPEDFNVQLLRVLAYYYDGELNDYETANKFRKAALERIDALLLTNLDEAKRLQYLFVSAAYHREFGETEKSDEMVNLLTTALRDSADKEIAGFVKYLTELKQDIPLIVPGGSLAPEQR